MKIYSFLRNVNFYEVSFIFLFSNDIILKQAQLEKLYSGLKELAQERRTKLEEALQLFALNREVDDIMQWIAEKEVTAGSQELGQDYEHVTVSIEISVYKISFCKLAYLHGS